MQRWARLDREKGSIATKPTGGSRPFALADGRERILERIAQQPDLPPRAFAVRIEKAAALRSAKIAVYEWMGRLDLATVPFSDKANARKIRQHLGHDPFNGQFFVFRGKRGDLRSCAGTASDYASSPSGLRKAGSSGRRRRRRCR